MNFLLVEALATRLGILLNDALMHVAVYGYAMFLTWLYVTAKLHGNDADILQLGVFMILAIVIFVAMRGDFFIHRFAAYLKYFAEVYLLGKGLELSSPVNGERIMSWEEWKGERKNTWMVGAMDGVAGLFLFILLYKFQAPLWSQGYTIFVIATSTAAVIIGLFAFFVPKLAGK